MTRYLKFLSLAAFFALGSCAYNSYYPEDEETPSNEVLDEEVKERLVQGKATVQDLLAAIEAYKAQGIIYLEHDAENDLPNHALVVNETGKLFVALEDNSAGWRSELYILRGHDIDLLFEDTRDGPLDVKTEFIYEAGTPIDFMLVTHTGIDNIVTTNFASTGQAQIGFDEVSGIWTIGFEDVMDGVPGLPDPDWDYNDAVITVEVVPAPFVDLANKFNINIEYLDHHGYNADGYVIYYIGETMHFNVNIDVLEHDNLFDGNQFVVYAFHEYFDTVTCDRYWYPSPPRPPDEPQTITVHKGDLMPNQEYPSAWAGLEFHAGQNLSLAGQYTSNLEVCAGNDQTHVLIVRENAQGQIEFTIYDNPEAGVFDPPPQ